MLVRRPGSLTLLLGPPGAGKSTLLKLLSGRLQQSRVVELRGVESLRYNGVGTDAFLIKRTASYVDQVWLVQRTRNTYDTVSVEHFVRQ